MTTIIDSNFLYALMDSSDKNHHRAAAAVRLVRGERLLPVLILAEVTYLLEKRVSRSAVRQFVDYVISSGMRIETLTTGDLVRIREILERYADSRIDFIDASIMALAERLKVTRIFTFDQRDFSIYRPSYCDRFELLP